MPRGQSYGLLVSVLTTTSVSPKKPPSVCVWRLFFDLTKSLPKPLRRRGCVPTKPIFNSINSLTPVPSPNGEGSENHCLQMKRASRWCKERLSSIGRRALLKWRRAFPCFCSFVIRIRVPMFLCLNSMSLNQYVFMSFCLKNYVLLS